MTVLACALSMFLAAAATPAAPDWTVNHSTSRIAFKGTVQGIPFTGLFRRWQASIRFDPKSLESSQIMVVIDTGSAATNDRDRDKLLPTAEWFAIARYPVARFSSTRIMRRGDGRYTAYGALTMKGETRTVALPFMLRLSGRKARAAGSLIIDRTMFDLGSGEWRTGEVVGTSVAVTFVLDAAQ